MYLLYLDDSGSPDNRNEAYFVLAGLCAHEKKIYWLNKHLEELAESISPGNADTVEFHAAEIFPGRKAPWKGMDREARRDVLKQVLAIGKREIKDCAIFACAVHKASYPGEDPVALAFEDLCSRFNLFLNRVYHKNNEKHSGLIILDESAHETTLQKLALNFRNIGTRWGVTSNIQEVPLFVNSKASRCIQLADHIAYAVFRRYNAEDLTYFNVIESCFDSDQEKLHGLIHKQTLNPQCTCPACMSRRLGGVRQP